MTIPEICVQDGAILGSPEVIMDADASGGYVHCDWKHVSEGPRAGYSMPVFQGHGTARWALGPKVLSCPIVKVFEITLGIWVWAWTSGSWLFPEFLLSSNSPFSSSYSHRKI